MTRVGQIVTFTFALNHGYDPDGLTKIVSSGFNEPEYNGLFTISNVTPLSFDVTVTGTPTTPGTGVGITKVAPLGWTKVYSGTNKGAFRANEVTGNRLYLRVNDANPGADSNRTCTWRGYETMSSVDTGTGLFPPSGQTTAGIYVGKSDTSDAVARPWFLIGDGFEFYLFTHWSTTYPSAFELAHFGDFASEAASDPYGVFIAGCYENPITFGGGNLPPGYVPNMQSVSGQNSIATVQSEHFIARAFSQVGASVVAAKVGNYALGGTEIGLSGVVPYPAPNNNALYVAPIHLTDTFCPRG